MNYKSLIDQIELKTKQLLSSYFENKGTHLSVPIDPIDIIEYLGYSVDYVSGKYDRNVYGALNPETKTVEVNNDVPFNRGMENFTLAHEIGHIVLHSRAHQKTGSNDACGIDQDYENSSKESEADEFASFLLMPTNMVLDAFDRIRNRPLYLKTNFFFRFFKRMNKRNRALAFAGRVIQAGGFFNVSKLAMVNRLIKMGLIRGLRFQKNVVIRQRGK